MPQPFVQVDAFTDKAFTGNPAAVCLGAAPAEDKWMQAVAREMNLSETAFLTPSADGVSDFGLRWFTPSVEVELCGHATLASAHVLFGDGHVPRSRAIRFSTLSGILSARSDGGTLVLDFPADPAEESEPPEGLSRALGAEPLWVGRGRAFCLVEIGSEEALRSLQPDLACVEKLPVAGVIVTCRSKSSEFDFISRVFAPAAGIPEDPVTGSAHCTLASFWAGRLQKTEMTGYQASARGGVVSVALKGSRVGLRGHAVTVARGEILY